MAAAMGAVLLLLVTVTAVSLPSTLGEPSTLHFVFGKIAAKLCCKLKRGSIKRLELFAAGIKGGALALNNRFLNIYSPFNDSFDDSFRLNHRSFSETLSSHPCTDAQPPSACLQIFDLLHYPCIATLLHSHTSTDGAIEFNLRFLNL